MARDECEQLDISNFHQALKHVVQDTPLALHVTLPAEPFLPLGCYALV
jgi:hypothetical protein